MQKTNYMVHNYLSRNYIAMMKVINLYLKNLGLKITITFKERTRIHLKLNWEKTSCRQKKNAFEQFLQIFVHADNITTKKDTCQRKNSKISPIVIKLFVDDNCKRCFIGNAIRENFSIKPDPEIKKLIPIRKAFKFTDKMMKNRIVYNFFFCVRTSFQHQDPDLYASPEIPVSF